MCRSIQSQAESGFSTRLVNDLFIVSHTNIMLIGLGQGYAFPSLRFSRYRPL